MPTSSRDTALTAFACDPLTASTVVSDGATIEPSVGGAVPAVVLYHNVSTFVLVLKKNSPGLQSRVKGKEGKRKDQDKSLLEAEVE